MKHINIKNNKINQLFKLLIICVTLMVPGHVGFASDSGIKQDDKAFLQDVIDRGVSNDKEFGHALLEHEKAESMVGEAWGSVLPTIQLQGGYTKLDNFQISFFSSPSSDSSVDFSQYTSWSASAVIRVGMSTIHALSAAGLSTDTSKLQLEASKNFAIINSLTTYFTYLMRVKMHELSLENMTVFKDQVALTTALANKGMARKSDVLSAKIGLNQAIQQEIIARKNKQVALEKLVVLLGEDFELQAVNIPTVTAIKDVMFKSHVFSKIGPVYSNGALDETLVAELEKDNLTLSALEKIKRLRHIDASAEHSRSQPHIVLNGSTGKSYYEGGADEGFDDTVLSASLSWTLFDGFSTGARVRQKEATAKQSELEHEKQREVFRQSLIQVMLDLNSWVVQAESLEHSLDLSAQNFEQIKQEYNQGQLRFTDVMRARNTLTDSSINLYSAKLQALGSYATLMSLVGPIDTTELLTFFN